MTDGRTYLENIMTIMFQGNNIFILFSQVIVSCVIRETFKISMLLLRYALQPHPSVYITCAKRKMRGTGIAPKTERGTHKMMVARIGMDKWTGTDGDAGGPGPRQRHGEGLRDGNEE